MLPIPTIGQVQDGNYGNTVSIDLSEYMKKQEGATKVELQSLTSVVANKLDAEPQHKHHIDDIKQLETALASKYDMSEKYSYNVILSDSEKIPYFESPKVCLLELSQDKESNGYKFYVDERNGDLLFVSPDNVQVAQYTKSTHSWLFSGLNINELPDIDTLQNAVDTLQNTDSSIQTALNNLIVTVNQDRQNSDINDAAIEAKITNHTALITKKHR